ncbi:hypothetical protein DCAR_0312952 [Daucus carota subsp. sativus]|uniref:Uncharacterized protein n=1 Tax=Daucus carota subsp. sativus TaxID=79200 RepID=A0A166BPA6_DAUCS|nr:hypothetical protein DCAR_0312952 [Daucus carota subsp. sativus]
MSKLVTCPRTICRSALCSNSSMEDWQLTASSLHPCNVSSQRLPAAILPNGYLLHLQGCKPTVQQSNTSKAPSNGS